MPHNWTYNANFGVHTNHALSDELLEESAGMCKMLPFTQMVEGFGKHMGETVNIPHVNRLPVPSNPRLAEGNRIPVSKLTFGNRTLTLIEMGHGVEATNLFLQLSKYNMRNVLQKELARQMEESIDNAIGGAFRDGTAVKICFIPTSATAGTFDTDGTPSTVATANLTATHIGILADYLSTTIHAPPFEGDSYVMLASTKTLRGLKDDDKMIARALYLREGDFFYRGEVGMIENVRIVQVMREGALPNTAGTSSVLGEAVLFGDEAMARIEAETPHLRLSNNYQDDFGRVQACAWYGILEFGSWWDTADDGQAKIIRITSA